MPEATGPLPPLDERLRRKIIEEERMALFDEAQAALESDFVLPPMPGLYARKYGPALKHAVAILIGGIIGAGIVLLNFFIFDRLLHISS